jgi:hypothetical protein
MERWTIFQKRDFHSQNVRSFNSITLLRLLSQTSDRQIVLDLWRIKS